MPLLYVFALTDAPVEPWREWEHDVESIRIRSVFAVCARQDEPPDWSTEALRRQHSIVRRIAESAPAVLPARFGSLVERSELTTLVRLRERVIRESLDLVRGNVQMTVRLRRSAADRQERVPSARDRRGADASSGRAYLERRRLESSPHIPPDVEAALEKLKPLVIAERRSTAAGPSIYHLVSRADAERYRAGLRNLKGVTVSGPWPAFAFTPELWL